MHISKCQRSNINSYSLNDYASDIVYLYIVQWQQCSCTLWFIISWIPMMLAACHSCLKTCDLSQVVFELSLPMSLYREIRSPAKKKKKTERSM